MQKRFLFFSNRILILFACLGGLVPVLYAETMTIIKSNGNKLEVSADGIIEWVGQSFYVKPGTYTFQIKPTPVPGWKAVVSDNLYTKSITIDNDPQNYWTLWNEKVVTRVQFETLARNPEGMPETIATITVKAVAMSQLSVWSRIETESMDCEGNVTNSATEWMEGEAPGAYRYESDCEEGGTSYSLQRYYYKFKFPAPLEVGQTIEWIEKHTPPDGEPIYTKKSWSASGGEIETPEDWSVFAIEPVDEVGSWSLLFPLLAVKATEIVDRDEAGNNHGRELSAGETQPLYVTDTKGDGITWQVDTTYVPAELKPLVSGYQWQAKGKGSQTVINGPTGSEWKITGNGLDWEADDYTISCDVTLDGIGSFKGNYRQQVGVRTRDTVVISWINPDLVNLAPLAAGVVNSNLLCDHDNFAILVSDWSTGIAEDESSLPTMGDRLYALARMAKEFAKDPQPFNSLPNSHAATDYVKSRIGYKLANRWEVKYLWRDNHFDDGVITVVGFDNDKHNQAVIGKSIVNVFGVLNWNFDGNPAQDNGTTFFSPANNQAGLLTAGTPHAIPAKVFQTIAGNSGHPVIWSKIWLGQNQAEPNQIQMTLFPSVRIFVETDSGILIERPDLQYDQVDPPSEFFMNNPTDFTEVP